MTDTEHIVTQQETPSAGDVNTLKTDNDDIKTALHDLIAKMFLKSNFENDKYLQASLNGSNAVPLETLLQAPDIIEVSNDMELIKSVLLESKAVIVTDDGIRPYMRPEQNTLILREIPGETTAEEVTAVFSNAPNCPAVVSVREDMNNMWFVTFASEVDARAALEAIKTSRLNDKPLKARLKTESTVKSYFRASPQAFPQMPRGVPGEFFQGGFPPDMMAAGLPMGMSNPAGGVYFGFPMMGPAGGFMPPMQPGAPGMPMMGFPQMMPMMAPMVNPGGKQWTQMLPNGMMAQPLPGPPMMPQPMIGMPRLPNQNSNGNGNNIRKFANNNRGFNNNGSRGPSNNNQQQGQWQNRQNRSGSGGSNGAVPSSSGGGSVDGSGFPEQTSSADGSPADESSGKQGSTVADIGPTQQHMYQQQQQLYYTPYSVPREDYRRPRPFTPAQQFSDGSGMAFAPQSGNSGVVDQSGNGYGGQRRQFNNGAQGNGGGYRNYPNNSNNGSNQYRKRQDAPPQSTQGTSEDGKPVYTYTGNDIVDAAPSAPAGATSHETAVNPDTTNPSSSTASQKRRTPRKDEVEGEIVNSNAPESTNVANTKDRRSSGTDKDGALSGRTVNSKNSKDSPDAKNASSNSNSNSNSNNNSSKGKSGDSKTAISKDRSKDKAKSVNIKQSSSPPVNFSLESDFPSLGLGGSTSHLVSDHASSAGYAAALRGVVEELPTQISHVSAPVSVPVVSSSEVPTSSSSSSNSGGVSHSQDSLGLSFGFDSSSVPSQAQSAYVSTQPVSHADSSSVSFTFGGFTSDEPPLSIASVPAPSPDGPTRQHEESSSESAESGSVWGVKKSFLDVVRKNT